MHLHTFIAAASTAFTSSLLAETFYVSQKGPADFTSIQDAVDAASNGDTILVHPGTYTSVDETEVLTTRGKELTIESIQGAANTFISGEQVRRCITVDSSEDFKTVIKGFTIVNGVGQQLADWEPTTGGGILVGNGSSPTFKDCVIQSCIAPTVSNKWTNAGGHGGGIACLDKSNPTFVNCTVTFCLAESTENHEGKGGGVYLFNNSGPAFIECTIAQNGAATGGGVACIGSESNQNLATFERCVLRENVALDVNGSMGGGGMYCWKRSVLSITECTFWMNEANTGGGIRCFRKGADPVITSSTFEMNVATSEADGGGGFKGEPYSGFGARPSIGDTTFCGNESDNINGYYIDLGDIQETEFCCDADINGDGLVGVDEILVIIAHWGTSDVNADVTNDGTVSADDILFVLSNWGACP